MLFPALTHGLRRSLNPLLLGAVHALCFADGPLPGVTLPYVQAASLTGLALCLLSSRNLRGAAWQGWLFGLGNFTVGLYWLFISMHTYGGLGAPPAAGAVLLFSAWLALYYALAALTARGCFNALKGSAPAGFARTLCASLGFASSWTLFEWIRGTAFTGFPWLNPGYAHIDGPFSGWAPIWGVYGLTWMAALTAVSIAMLMLARRAQAAEAAALRPGEAGAAGSVALAVVLALGGMALGQWQWASPLGAPVIFRLTQGNIPQSEKFDPALMQQALETTMRLAAEPAKSDAARPGVIVTPETVMPLFQDDYSPEVWDVWRQIAITQQAALIVGVPLRETAANGGVRYTNSVIGMTAETDLDALYKGRPSQRYDKHHLVPFGEFIPPMFRWFTDAMNIPLGDFNRGEPRQPLFSIEGQHIALNICYEDVFGEEIVQTVRAHPEHGAGASILLNVSNLGWFGDSWALGQHLQMSRMRALETARPMLRATNTGITGAIGPDGAVMAVLPVRSRSILDIEVQGTQGTTPYVRWGNAAVLLLSLAGLIAALGLSRLGGLRPAA
jgi:apolipoprotein N-acyltransferase